MGWNNDYDDDYGYGPSMSYREIERRMSMYCPEEYRRMRPIVVDICDMMDDPRRYPVVPRALWNRMMDECMRRYRMQYPSSEFDNSWDDDMWGSYSSNNDYNYDDYNAPTSVPEEEKTRDEQIEVEPQQFFRRRFLVPLLSVILVSELLFRRRRFFF